jgi:hypothetical protein
MTGWETTPASSPRPVVRAVFPIIVFPITGRDLVRFVAGAPVEVA